MTKPKIYFLVNSLEGGGAERVITNVSSKLRENYEIDIITLKAGTFYDIPEWVNHISLSNIRHNFLLIVLFPLFLFRWNNLLKTWNYKNGVSFLEIANFIHILSRPDAIISFRTSIGVFKGLFWFFYKSLIRILYPRAKQIIVNSEENRFELAEYLNLPLDKITTIYNPIDTQKVAKDAQEAIDDSLKNQIAWKRVFITVSRLVADDAIGSKNHSLVLNIFKRLLEKWEKNFIYLIVWDGPALDALEDQVKWDWLKDHVVFLGKQRNVFKYLAVSDYVIYASRHEWFPNALIEAMAVSVPIITSNFKTGAHEVITGEYTNGASSYPLFWANGVILDINHFEEQFFDIYEKIYLIKNEKRWIEHFENAEQSFEKVLRSV